MGDFEQNISAEKLLEMYSDMVYRLAYARTNSKHDAEDITQDVFLKYIKSNVKFNDEEHRKAWLLKVTANTGKSFVTSAWFRHRADIEDADNISVCMEEKGSVYYAVQKLPEKYRTVVHLFYYEELSVAQISKIVGSKESTVKSQLHRAREMLKEILKEEQYEF
ncbi:MAG: RNA polymerase sigma factor [Hominimerdicola sp.]